LIELEERRSDLALLDKKVEEILQQLPPDIEQQRREEIEAATRELLQGRRDLLDSLVSDYNTYLSNLVDLDSSQRTLLATATQYSAFIDRNVLWVQSHTAMGLKSLGDAWDALQWMGAPENLGALARFLWRDLRRQAAFYGAFLLALGLLLGYRRQGKKKIQALADDLHRTESDSITHTAWALGLSVVRAAPAPLCLLFLGWRLSLATQAPTYVRAVGNGLWATGVYWGVLAFLTVLCLRKGLMDSHFRMREEAPAMVRTHLHWFALIALPAIFVVRTLQWQPNEVWAESMGRFAFMGGALALAAFLAVVLRPNGAVVQALLRRTRGSWFGRARYAWYGLAVVFPAALPIAAGLGYYYSALQLQSRLRWSILLILGVLLVQKLTVRWLLLVRRRLAVERAQEKRAAAEQRKEAGEAEGEGQSPQAVPEQEEDLFALSMQTRRFLRAFLGVALVAGLWLIWSDVLPALGILRKVELWSVTAGAGENGQIAHITLADILLAIIIFVLAVVAARNLPGILEMAVLQHLPIDRGVRFAISTLSRYTIVAVGVVLTATQMGIGWAKVQWLVAAMGVGLGFGLQEIFGNFISGLIILFERPMRVGDTVTVGDVFGTVTQIRIRATTIQQWDRKELIVPNKEFITGRLINWTLSDTILRMEFPVGIAYGSDTEMAEKRLMEVAQASEHVLDDPPPRVVFKSFGDSSLLFELRVFIPDMDSYVPTWHGINRAIDNAFRESKIVIAFPQRDVNLKLTQKELPVALQQQSPDHPGETEQEEQNGQ
jgi:potassium efflux system protein